MVFRFYGLTVPLQKVRDLAGVYTQGTTLNRLRLAAEELGFEALAVRLPLLDREEGPSLSNIALPAILPWASRHFVVLYRIDRTGAWIADPEKGRRRIPLDQLPEYWQLDEDQQGVVLLLEPGNAPKPSITSNKVDSALQTWQPLWKYLHPHRRLFIQLWVGLSALLLVQLVIPFLTQAVVDVGIEQRDLSFITLILLAQLALLLGQALISALQQWVFLYIGTQVNMDLIGDYIQQLTRLPIRFFQQRSTGDLLQRMADHSRIEEFLTASVANSLYAGVSLLVFSFILWWYYPPIFWVFALGSLLYLGWVVFFLQKRKRADEAQFKQLSDHQHALLEILQGMLDIKLQNSERKRRDYWESIQLQLFRANLQYLQVSQYQETGARILGQLRDVAVVFLSARAVVQGQMTLGMMLAVQFIVGQLTSPLQQLSALLQSGQDARLSLNRLQEVQDLEGEPEGRVEGPLPLKQGLQLQSVHFGYYRDEPPVLKELLLDIPFGKMTAIVGASGSGKSTLIKLLLQLYSPWSGYIRWGDQHLSDIPPAFWRRQCAAVLQESRLFSESVLQNITEGAEEVEEDFVDQLVRMCQLEAVIKALPKGIHTKIGPRGHPLSRGQEQRILLARALYRRADYLFLDEATNALDAVVEKRIMEQVRQFQHGHTLIVAAHRLSTVRNADRIVVLEEGYIREQGSHEELVERGGIYAALVAEQQ